MKNKSYRFKKTPVVIGCLLLILTSSQTIASPINFSQLPPGGGGREPAPNIIISVDDSGSMGTTGIAALKAALNTSFSTTAVPDDRVRIAYQAMWRCRGLSASPYKSYGSTCPDNRMSSLSGTHRTNFNTWVNSLQPANTTPSHLMIKYAGEYMKTTGLYNPFAKIPGVQEAPLLGCRKSFHIFMTDGEWNSETTAGNNPGTVGNADGTSRTLPDGVSYDTSASDTQTRIYRDTRGTGTINTLADYTFEYWATDLQPTIPNDVKFTYKESSPIDFGTIGSPYVINPYWNPKNNPANWQSLTTYTIGFGAGAALSTTTSPKWGGVSGTTWSGGDYSNLIKGTVTWRDPITDTTTARRQELWHMALNGRGRYTPATDAAALSAAFSEIINQILLDTSSPLVSIASSSSYLTTGLNAYIAGYKNEKWSGNLAARPIDPSAGTISATESWNAATSLDSISAVNLLNRVVLSYDGTIGIPWKSFSSLPLAQQNQLNSNSASIPDSNGQNRVNYIRGDRSNEQNQVGGLAIFRNRDSRLGDIVNSNIWYTGAPASGYSANGYSSFKSSNSGRTPMIYVGANDGMLHGFSTLDGAEKLAYIPRGVAEGDLRKLTDPTYSHQYFIDGSPFTGDAYLGTWKTVLVGTLGAGGKGYFILDATNPSNFTDANAANVVLFDTTKTTDIDVGSIISPPLLDDAIDNKSKQIVKMNNDRWAVVMGNGYNSTSEAPVLLIQYLDGDKSLKKLSGCTLPTSNACVFKGGNGMSTPHPIDLNGDGKIDVIYSGDLKGNLWKFNVTSTNDSAWNTSFSGQPFFVAKPGALTQPITAAPFWMNHPLGGLMIAVGTGQNLTTDDQTSIDTNTLYALYDDSTITFSGSSVSISDTSAINSVNSAALPSNLVQQTITTGLTDTDTTNYFRSTSNPVIYTGATPKRGWYMNWSIAGQRVLRNMTGFTGQKFLIPSIKPASGGVSTGETCSAPSVGERSFSTVLNMFTGNPSSLPAFSLVNLTTSNTDITTREGGAGDSIYFRSDEKFQEVKPCPSGQICSPKEFIPGKFLGTRSNWRVSQ